MTLSLSYREVLFVIYPIFDFTVCLSFLTSTESTKAVPLEGVSIPAIILNVVVLPQPLGPNMLATEPFLISKFRSLTAQNGFFFGPNKPFSSDGALNCLDKFLTSIIFENF